MLIVSDILSNNHR